MAWYSMRAGAFVCGMVSAAGLAQEAEEASQSEVTINNLQHAEGTETCRLGEIGVEKAGHGEDVLILLAGAPFGADKWSSFMERNAERYTMYALTPAGYEGSNPPPMPDDVTRAETGEWTDAFLDAASALIERDGLDRFVLVGHHLMSDYYAMRLAAAHEERVRAVVLVAPMLQTLGGQLGQGREARIAFANEQRIPFFQTVPDEVWNKNTFPATMLSADEARGAALFQEQISTARPTQIRYYVEYLASDEPELISRVKAPVVVIAPPARAMTAETAIDGAVASVMSGQGLDQEQALALVMTGIEQQFGSKEGLEEFLANRPRPWEMGEWASDVKTIDVEDCASFVMLDRPERFDEAMVEALK